MRVANKGNVAGNVGIIMMRARRERDESARASGPSLARSREARFACLNRSACSQAKAYSADKKSILE